MPINPAAVDFKAGPSSQRVELSKLDFTSFGALEKKAGAGLAFLLAREALGELSREQIDAVAARLLGKRSTLSDTSGSKDWRDQLRDLTLKMRRNSLAEEFGRALAQLQPQGNPLRAEQPQQPPLPQRTFAAQTLVDDLARLTPGEFSDVCLVLGLNDENVGDRRASAHARATELVRQAGADDVLGAARVVAAVREGRDVTSVVFASKAGPSPASSNFQAEPPPHSFMPATGGPAGPPTLYEAIDLWGIEKPDAAPPRADPAVLVEALQQCTAEELEMIAFTCSNARLSRDDLGKRVVMPGGEALTGSAAEAVWLVAQAERRHLLSSLAAAIHEQFPKREFPVAAQSPLAAVALAVVRGELARYPA